MYCHSCNVEFDEGLRYCKWCGQHLTDRPRVTSELNKCHNCGEAIQPTWAFCKGCGIKLTSTAEKPEVHCPGCGVVVEATATSCLSCGTALLGRFETRQAPIPALFCPSCGLDVEVGATFCKSCGAIIARGGFTEPSSGRLPCPECGAPNSQDSAACNQCGAALDSAPAERGTAFRNANTIPDLTTDPSSAGLVAPRPVPTVEHVTGDVSGGVVAESSIGQQPPVGEPAAGQPATLETSTSRPSEPLAGESTTRLMEVQTLDFPGPEVPASPPHHHDETGHRVESEDQMREARMAWAIEPAAPAPPLSPEMGGPGPQMIPTTGTFPQPPQVSTPAGNPPPVTGEFAAAPPPGPPPPPAARAASAGAINTNPQGAPVAPAKKGGSKAPILILVGIVLLAFLGGGGYFAWRTWIGPRLKARSTGPVAGPTPVESPSPSPVATATPTPAATPPPEALPQGMVAVPAGAYSVGRDDGDRYAKPAHSVDLAAFYIDRTEVTNADYKKFCVATQHDPPSDWQNGDYAAGHDDWPVVMVTWQDAVDYATWAGKRLPTEAEWEAAARGPAGLIYPWGNEWDPHNANVQNKSIMSIGQFPLGASFCGALDMIGNVWEWTASEFTVYPGSNAPRPDAIEPGMTFRVIRGGAYDGIKSNDATYRGFVDEAKGLPKTGFRCAKNAYGT